MAYKYRCPYCGEPTITLFEKMGGALTLLEAEDARTKVFCPHCENWCYKRLGALGRRGYLWCLGWSWIAVFAAVIYLVIVGLETLVWWLIGGAVILYVALNILFVYFDKRTKAEREADARLTFIVAGKHAFVKKWGIYLVRFPKRGTNEHSPVLYAMVCGKRGKKTERTYTLRVIRADNMDLPDLGEPAWLITNAQKVVEGTITAATPKKEL